MGDTFLATSLLLSTRDLPSFPTMRFTIPFALILVFLCINPVIAGRFQKGTWVAAKRPEDGKWYPATFQGRVLGDMGLTGLVVVDYDHPYFRQNRIPDDD